MARSRTMCSATNRSIMLGHGRCSALVFDVAVRIATFVD
jgi:hypothetical protein